MPKNADDVTSVLRGRSPRMRLPGRNRTKADIVVFGGDGRTIAVKDYGPRPFWIRQTVGRFLVRRECRAYAAAGDLPGLAGFLGRVGPYALAIAWIDARSLRDRRGEPVDAAVFEALSRIVESLHERGIALGDLHHRDVLVSDGGEVHVVDLATAWILGPRPSPMRRRIFTRLKENDRVAVARLRARFLRGSESAWESEVGADAVRRVLRARKWKRIWNRLRGRR